MTSNRPLERHPASSLPAAQAATSAPGLTSSPAGGGFSKYRVLDLFSGIGGFSLGLERTGGFETVAFCEIEEFPRKVLAKHWPEVPCYEDVRTLTGARLAADGITGIDVITGGFPCQDLSVAGKQRGMGEGTRSGLWSEIVRLVGELRPSFVIVENVAALLAGPSSKPGGWFGRVLGDLAECGYDAEWENIPAAALGAPHRRERCYFVGHPKEINVGQMLGSLRTAGESRRNAWESWPDRLDQSRVCRGNDGVPGDVDRLAALGNAVVPQIPELIGRAILNSATRPHPRRADPGFSPVEQPPAHIPAWQRVDGGLS